MRLLHVVAVSAALLSVRAMAAEFATVQGHFERDGKRHVLSRGVAWQSARPDTLVVVLADADVALMDVRHPARLQQLAEEGKLRGLRFEFDPGRLDPRWVSGRYMTAEWSTYRPPPPVSWKKLERANGRIEGTLDAGGVQVAFGIPIVGAVEPRVLTGVEAHVSPLVEVLLGYEDAVRKGDWKKAAKYLTPLSAAALEREVATEHGLGQFKTAGRYLSEYMPRGEARRAGIQKVIVSGEDAAVISDGFAADFVRVGGRWLKI